MQFSSPCRQFLFFSFKGQRPQPGWKAPLVRSPAVYMAYTACLGPQFSPMMCYIIKSRRAVWGHCLSTRCPIAGDPPHSTLRGLHPWGPTLGLRGWEGPIGSSQLPVPGNSGLSSGGWNLANNQEEMALLLPAPEDASLKASQSRRTSACAHVSCCWPLPSEANKQKSTLNHCCVREFNMSPTQILLVPKRLCPTTALSSGHSPQNPRGHLSSFPHQVFYFYYCHGQALIPQDCVTGSPLHGSYACPLNPPSHSDHSSPQPATCHVYITKPSSQRVFSKLPNFPPRDIPRACRAGSSTMLSAPFPTSCPLLHQEPSTLTAVSPSTRPLSPKPLFIFGPDAGQPEWNAHPLPAYLNPPNSSKTSSRPSPLSAASWLLLGPCEAASSYLDRWAFLPSK